MADIDVGIVVRNDLENEAEDVWDSVDGLAEDAEEDVVIHNLNDATRQLEAIDDDADATGGGVWDLVWAPQACPHRKHSATMPPSPSFGGMGLRPGGYSVA